MRILGVRNAPSTIRYAILDGTRGDFQFTNVDEEHRIVFPRRLANPVEKLVWAYSEICRVVSQFGPFDVIALKHNENVKTSYTSLKPTAFLDALVHLAAGQNNIKLVSYTYSNLGTNRHGVVDKAEQRVGRTTIHWDQQIADAILAAWKALSEA